MINALGIVGLGTMGENLARNAARNGAAVSVFNRTPEKTDAFMKEYGGEGTFAAFHSLVEMIRSLPQPRAIILMVKAGEAVDRMIGEIAPNLEKGDILIDGGNSHYRDTERRETALKEKGIRFVGMGISGGAEGALKGPSMMPGGNREAVELLLPLLTKMSADDGDGGKCVSYMGPGGAGHFVKMVHNGIEYGMMQLIAETYDVLKSCGGYLNAELSALYESWAESPELSSYLVEITARVFKTRDPESGTDILDLIRDAAGQKGTGRWTTLSALEYGVAVPTITAGLDARIISSSKSLRERSQSLPVEVAAAQQPSVDHLGRLAGNALEFSMICAYKQGFMLIEEASKEENWGIDSSACARIWRGGCIIRSLQLRHWQQLFGDDAGASMKANEYFHLRLRETQRACREFIALAVVSGVPVAALSASLHYYDAVRRPHLPANLIQAQRDFFGAHGFERVDLPGNFHVEWKS
ncbi:MAG: NADP-dependent phosphogluconate dehydrogenase [Candidatus Peribacteraceae bacterium]|jgi:6-phosphogluconate dehydrogenase